MGQGNQKNIILSQKGFSLIQVLIAFALMMSLTLGFSQFFVQQFQQVKRLETKLAVLEYERFVQNSMASSEVCTCNFSKDKNTWTTKNLEFDSTVRDGTEFIEMDILKDKCDVPGFTGEVLFRVGSPVDSMSTLTTRRLVLGNLTPVSNDPNETVWNGNLYVSFNQNGKPLQMKPLSSRLKFSVDRTSPSQTKITSCLRNDENNLLSYANSTAYPNIIAKGTGIEDYVTQTVSHTFCMIEFVQSGGGIDGWCKAERLGERSWELQAFDGNEDDEVIHSPIYADQSQRCDFRCYD